MPSRFQDNALSIGHTPLTQPNRPSLPATVLAQCAARNRAYPLMCRTGTVPADAICMPA